MKQNIEYYQARFGNLIEEISELSGINFQIDYSADCILNESGKEIQRLEYGKMAYYLLGMLRILEMQKKRK